MSSERVSEQDLPKMGQDQPIKKRRSAFIDKNQDDEDFEDDAEVNDAFKDGIKDMGKAREHKQTEYISLKGEQMIDKPITIAVCCMDKKSGSKPMHHIMTNLEAYSDINIIMFKEELFMHKPVEEWPKVDVMISFYSQGFPIDKVLKYVNI